MVDRYGGANLGEKSGVSRGVVFLAWGAWAAKRVAKLSKVRACVRVGSRALHPKRKHRLAPFSFSSPIPRLPPPSSHKRRFYSFVCSSLFRSPACIYIYQPSLVCHIKQFFFSPSSR